MRNGDVVRSKDVRSGDVVRKLPGTEGLPTSVAMVLSVETLVNVVQTPMPGQVRSTSQGKDLAAIALLLSIVPEVSKVFLPLISIVPRTTTCIDVQIRSFPNPF